MGIFGQRDEKMGVKLLSRGGIWYNTPITRLTLMRLVIFVRKCNFKKMNRNWYWFFHFLREKKKVSKCFFLNLSSPKGKEIGRCEYSHVSISSFQECLMRCYINRRWYRTENYDYVGINNFFWQMRIYLLF